MMHTYVIVNEKMFLVYHTKPYIGTEAKCLETNKVERISDRYMTNLKKIKDRILEVFF